MIRKTISLPIIIDAGLGTASDAAICMEMGMDGVLVNTAIAQASDPVRMAQAFRLGCEAGRPCLPSWKNSQTAICYPF